MTLAHRRIIRSWAIPAAATGLAPTAASAHAFGARYDLPLPLDIYLVGAGLVVLLTFVVAALFLRPGGRLPGGQVDISVSIPATAIRSLRWLGMAVGLFIFALVLAAALLGNESPTRNFAPTFVWVIWWVGFAYLAALVVNLWPWLNPWRPLALATARISHPHDGAGWLRYPARLGHWPAVLLFAAFAWIELVSEVGEEPRTLAVLILVYTALTAAGALLYGARAWLAHGEVFTVAFGVFGRFAPIELGHADARLRLLGRGLLIKEPVSAGVMTFVVLMLSTVTFDGFLETPAWAGILDWLVEDQTVRPLLLWLQQAGVDLLAMVETVGLMAFPLIFLCVYLFFAWLIGKMAGTRRPLLEVGRAFVLSLVPIAIAYHLAHYYPFLLLAGQLIIPLASDPFGFGWDVFGTASRAIDITVVNAKTTWYVAVSAIVLGHVIAVLIGHLTALRVFDGHRAALLSQIPMTVLMIAYTMLSLWILSQPIVESPTF